MVRNLSYEEPNKDGTTYLEVRYESRVSDLRIPRQKQKPLRWKKNITGCYQQQFFTGFTTKLNDLFIDPKTSGAVDKDKLFINLHIEMEEGIRLVTFTDKNGKTVEEIIFE